MRYRMIGIDLDGTLLDAEGRVSKQNRNAIARAHEAGVLVVPCTGRSWHESHRPLDEVEGLSVGVFVTGAIINQIHTSEAINTVAFEPSEALALVERLKSLPDAVLVFRERGAVGCDYMVTGQGQLPENTAWWFDYTQAKVDHRAVVTLDDLTHVLRIAVVSYDAAIEDVFTQVSEEFGDRVTGHCFGGIVRKDAQKKVRILEFFSPQVTKWRGLQWIAKQHDIADEQIAVIGDEVNDLPMLVGAGCGIAMANAVDQARAHADHITATNHDHGVALAIDHLLEGRWGNVQ